MALNWPDARVAVRFEREAREDEKGYAPDTIVVVMRPDQVDDPDFVREMRRIVAARSIEREYERHSERARHDGADDETCEEERRFVSNFLGADGGSRTTPSPSSSTTCWTRPLGCRAGPPGRAWRPDSSSGTATRSW